MNNKLQKISQYILKQVQSPTRNVEFKYRSLSNEGVHKYHPLIQENYIITTYSSKPSIYTRPFPQTSYCTVIAINTPLNLSFI